MLTLTTMLRRMPILLYFLLCVAALLDAQEYRATLLGVVTDSSGSAVASVHSRQSFAEREPQSAPTNFKSMA